MTARTNGDARPDGVSLLDKVQFFSWACERHQLEAADMNVLRVILFDLLGLEDGKPHNAWTTAAVVARMCGLTDRTVRRALDRLRALGLVTTVGTARGRYGKTILQVPGVVGATQNLDRRKLTDRPDDEPPSKLGRSRPNKTVEIRTQPSVKLGRCRPMNPLKESSYGKEPSDRAPGGAASRSGEPGFEFGLGEEKRAYGEDEPDALTRPRERLKRRLAGVANKLGLQDGGEGLLQASDETTVERWLRLQREDEARQRKGKAKGSRLFKAFTVALVDHYKLNDKQVGRKLAVKAEPPPPEPAKPSANRTHASHSAAAKRPPTFASPSPSRPSPTANGGAGLRTVAGAIRDPVLAPPPPCRIVYSRDVLLASADSLGIPRKGLAS